MLLPYHFQHSKSSPASALLLDLRSELLQHYLLHISSFLASQKQVIVELGNNTSIEKGKVVS